MKIAIFCALDFEREFFNGVLAFITPLRVRPSPPSPHIGRDETIHWLLPTLAVAGQS
jgi:hypothetical protein